MQQRRRGFSILTALFIIILMSSVGALIANLSTKSTTSAVNQYQKVQAVLLAKSYTEYAIMVITSQDRTTGCIQTLNGTYNAGGDNTFTVTVDIKYLGNATDLGLCPGTTAATLDTLNVTLDTYIRYKDLNTLLGNNAPLITYHRRTLQKI